MPKNHPHNDFVGLSVLCSLKLILFCYHEYEKAYAVKPKSRNGHPPFSINGLSYFYQRPHDTYIFSMMSNSLSDGIRSPFFNLSNVAQNGCSVAQVPFGPYT